MEMDMRDPDGTVYPNTYRFVSIAPDRIVIIHPHETHGFLVEVLLERCGDDTMLTWSQTFDDADEFEKVRSFVPECNEQMLSRLTLELAKLFKNEFEALIRTRPGRARTDAVSQNGGGGGG